MSSPEESSGAENGVAEALALVSLELDGQLTPEDARRLAVLSGRWGRQMELFRRQVSEARKSLKSLPVRRVSKPLVTAAGLAQTFGPAGRSAGDSRSLPARAERSRKNRGHVLRWASVVTAMLMVAAGSVLVQRLWFGTVEDDLAVADAATQKADGEASFYMMAPSDRAAGHSLASDSPIAAERMEEFDQAVMEAGAMASVANESLADTETSNSPTNPIVEPFLRTSDWDVVVLQVSLADRSVAMKQIEDFMQQHGFDITQHHDEESPEPPDWMGVVLTSAPAVYQQMTDAAVSHWMVDGVERDPGTIAEKSREELIEAVRRSLQTPTESELFHGRVYIAVPRESAKSERRNLDLALAGIDASGNPPGRNDAGGNPAADDGSVAGKTDRTPGGIGRPGRSLSPQNSRPVLLVFRFREPPESPPDAATSDGRI